MGAISLDIEASLATAGLTVRIANYAVTGPDPVFRCCPEYYLSHLLSRVRSPGAEAPAKSAAERNDASGLYHFMPARRPINYRPVWAAGRVAQCIFEPQLFEGLTGAPANWTEAELHPYMNVQHPGIRTNMARLEQEVRLPSFGSLILVEALGRTIMVDLARYWNSNQLAPPPHGRLGRWQVDRIVDYVHANCGKGVKPTTADLARLCNVSSGHLQRSFKKTTGKTLHQFVEQVRIDKARDLLRETNLPLKVIAAAAGFAAASRLSEAFRRHTGEQPRCYRSRVRGVGRTAATMPATLAI